MSVHSREGRMNVSASAVPVTALGNAEPRGRAVSSNSNSSASTISVEAEPTVEPPAAAPAPNRYANMPVVVPAAACDRERTEISGLLKPDDIPPFMDITRQIAELEAQAAIACRPCEEIRARLATLRKQLPGTIPDVRYGPKKVAGACISAPAPFTVKIAFIRHSESCANVLKRNTRFGSVSQSVYTDPELSGRGNAMAVERAGQMPAVLAAAGITATDPVIVCSSALFRAQQTALHLVGGIPAAQRASDRIIVLPYIQESGGGYENTAFSDVDRAARGYYEKLPGGAASRERIVTSLFSAAGNGAKTPNITNFFKWLGCNMFAIQKAAAATALATQLNLVIVTHSNLMTQLYAAFGGAKMKYDNLEGFAMAVNYSQFGELVGRPEIRAAELRYVPGPTIPESCPDTTCRKQPVCSSSATAKATAKMAAISADPTLCSSLDTLTPESVGARVTADVYKARIKPVADRLKLSKDPRAATAQKALAAYEPPGAFMSMFRTARNPATSLATNVAAAKAILCPAAASEKPMVGGRKTRRRHRTTRKQNKHR